MRQAELFLKAYIQTEARVNDLAYEIQKAKSPELIKALSEEETRLEEMLTKIEDAVKRLDDVRLRRVLWLRYVGIIVNGKRYRLTQWQIAQEMNYSREWVQKAQAKALEMLVIE